MRKIEQEMIKALQENRNWKKSNTEVVIYLNHYGQGLHRKEVYLHDNLIWTSCGCDGYDTYDNCGWNSATTRSRFNALSSVFSGRPHFSIRKGRIVCQEYFSSRRTSTDGSTTWCIGRL